MRDLVELEISRAGSYPQGEITMEDLEEIARAYDPLLHEAPLVLDHAPPGEEHRGPAYGWVKELKRLGDTLVARISQVPAELKELVSSGRYKHRSAEVYLDFQGTGKKYLKRVALLGAAIPAVEGMAPITFAADGGPSATVEFDQPQSTKEEKPMGTNYTKEQVDQLIEAAVTKAAEKGKAEATATFESQLEEKDKEIATFKERAANAEGKLADAEKETAKLHAEAEESEVAAFCDKLVSLGKVTPAEAKDLKVTLLALPDDEESVIKYDEGKDMTPRRKLMGTYDARQQASAVPLEEVAKHASEDGDTVAFGEAEGRFEVSRSVVQYYEKNKRDFVKMGVSLEDHARSELHHSAA
ncbi:MAG: GPO family capsid scaffolding protein [bacterium]|nr:GPO family capsid scaffolding protein [bacterium]